MRIAIVGGGINGVMSAWELAARGQEVTLFEARELMSGTSSRSTKLLHGGLRYLEHGHLQLVRSSLKEREWWITRAPELASAIEIVLPVYEHSRRWAWKIGAGLFLYDRLAGRQKLGSYCWHPRQKALELCPELNPEGLHGVFTFHDAQMRDRELGLWAADQATRWGVHIRVNAPVDAVETNGRICIGRDKIQFDRVVNVTGPWARRLLERSGIPSDYQLDLVRGSHLLIRGVLTRNYLIEVPEEERICFVLQYHGETLIGTTELRQTLDDPIACSREEREYLLRVYNHYFRSRIGSAQIASEFAGLRPLIRSHSNPSRASREYVIERNQNLVSVFGGKWTTSRLLGCEVADVVESAS